MKQWRSDGCWWCACVKRRKEVKKKSENVPGSNGAGLAKCRLWWSLRSRLRRSRHRCHQQTIWRKIPVHDLASGDQSLYWTEELIAGHHEHTDHSFTTSNTAQHTHRHLVSVTTHTLPPGECQLTKEHGGVTWHMPRIWGSKSTPSQKSTRLLPMTTASCYKITQESDHNFWANTENRQRLRIWERQMQTQTIICIKFLILVSNNSTSKERTSDVLDSIAATAAFYTWHLGQFSRKDFQCISVGQTTPKIAASLWGIGIHLIHDSLGPPKSAHPPPKQHLDQLSCICRAHNIDIRHITLLHV